MLLSYISIAALAGAVVGQSSPSLNDTLANNARLTNLTIFLGQFPGLLRTLSGASNITILAPSNEAFSKLLQTPAGEQLAKNPSSVQATLQYHVLNGSYKASDLANKTSFIPTSLNDNTYTNVTGGQRVEAVVVNGNTSFFGGLLQNATVVQADNAFQGGILHVVDSVLPVPTNVSATALSSNLTAFYGALNATNLTSTVNGLRDVTIFAPSNAAFQSIGSALANLSTTDLMNLLTYHVVNGTVGYNIGLQNGTTLKSTGGSDITIRADNSSSIFVNSAKVITPNILISNGVLHIIDNVLNPNNTSAAPSSSASAGSPAFTGASSASNIPFTSGVPTPTISVPTNSAPGGGSQPTSSKSAGAGVPMKTAAVGPAMLFGGAAAIMINL